MANTKISALTTGTPAVGTDEFPIARAGANRKLTLAQLVTLASTSPSFTGPLDASGVTSATGIPLKLAMWGVPVGMAPSGSMGNNGAVTLGTALDVIYTGGLWLYFPAGAVAAGVPAAPTFLWTVMSSTTVGTVYNSTFDGLSVPAVGSTATPYATTGPGAYTGVTAATVVATIPVAANLLGSTGAIIGDWTAMWNTAAGNKVFDLFYNGTGGTDYANFAGSTQGGGVNAHTVIRNQSTGIQYGGTDGGSSSQWGSGKVGPGAADTTGATTLVFQLTNATATNWVMLNGGTFFTLR